MTTITTLTTTTLDGKRPAIYEFEKVIVEQRENVQSSTIEIPLETQAPIEELQAQPPSIQRALLVHAAQQPYALVADHAIPDILHKDEILIKIVAIGLNPVDWKGPAYNFGLPSLPWVNGRDLAGVIVNTHASHTTSESPTRLKKGDLVIVPSTDYRDIRKAAFQEYAVATHFNAARIPESTSPAAAASAGVAFVASMLALGVSLGLDFSKIKECAGPNLADIVSRVDVETIPPDVRGECLASRDEVERPRAGEWIAIWGASTTTGLLTIQLARLAGLKTIAVADIARHGSKLHAAGADILIDRHDKARAVEIIRGVTGNKLRFAIDIVGSETSTLLQAALNPSIREDGSHAHLLGLTGLPKGDLRVERIVYHTVPIKVFHTCPEVGEAMVVWLEKLMESRTLELPEVVRADGGLEGVNEALEMLKRGDASGKRIVVELD
ncbi:zinc-binding alcohol dehydrogenase family protein [Aspergillus stella-maris]|uniref:zinc-binding alcohol dehydrogenase family protein n=1 Tax=Aspergillus stella-maris TaxID=1810926 RepID=UPI003CCD1E24